MTQNESLLGSLTNLLKDGSIAKSRCSFHLLRALEPLLDAGVVAEVSIQGGRRLVVRDAAALQKFSLRNFPDTTPEGDHTSREAGVGRFRDSKSFASDTPEILCVRAWKENALLKDGKPAGAARVTSEHRVFSFVLNDHYTLRGPCALVENPAVFLQFERLKLPIGLVILSGRGRVSRQAIDWLGGNIAPDFTLIHLPDYDPVGMLEFTRLCGRLGPRVRLHLPEKLADLFARFSNQAILDKPNNRAMLANLRASNLAEVQLIVALMDRNNACLEQEALLLPTKTE